MYWAFWNLTNVRIYKSAEHVDTAQLWITEFGRTRVRICLRLWIMCWIRICIFIIMRIHMIVWLWIRIPIAAYVLVCQYYWCRYCTNFYDLVAVPIILYICINNWYSTSPLSMMYSMNFYKITEKEFGYQIVKIMPST